MSTEHDIGALKADMANVKADVSYIREHMVTRREFDATASEHIKFRSDIDSLLASRARNTILSQWGERVLWAVICAGTIAALGIAI